LKQEIKEKASAEKEGKGGAATEKRKVKRHIKPKRGLIRISPLSTTS
jgi:hypothetical protein